ncbi:butyrate kinase [delta proteobacterium NaphS2]|nr:butyrate kinase [delta proteobacterium NaphS2]
MYTILAINIGSTSTKLGLFRNENPLFLKTVHHNSSELVSFRTFIEQSTFRREIIEEVLRQKEVKLEDIDLIVSRGGGTKPIDTGIYRINQLMCDDLLSGKFERHPANLGPVISLSLSRKIDVPAIIVDSPSSDEFEPIARISGIPEINRRSGFHVLSQKAAAEKAARDLGKCYGDINLIVGHLGGGISIGAHKKGKIIDASHGIEEGPFTPERSGGLPVLSVVELCFSGDYNKDQLLRKLVGGGGLTAYLGTNDAMEIEKKISRGDKNCEGIYRAMAYQISKEIGAMSAVLKGVVDVIVLTGGLSHSRLLTEWVREMVDFIAPVKVFPGEDEMQALADGGLRFLRGEEGAKEYD